MKRKLLIVLLAAAVLLCSCSQKEKEHFLPEAENDHLFTTMP